MEEQSNEALWYVVHTYSGYENKVATDLQTMVENRRLQDLICRDAREDLGAHVGVVCFELKQLFQHACSL